VPTIKTSTERTLTGTVIWLICTAVACALAVLMSLLMDRPTESGVPAAPLHFLDYWLGAELNQ
jgi:hypothetical protein